MNENIKSERMNEGKIQWKNKVEKREKGRKKIKKKGDREEMNGRNRKREVMNKGKKRNNE